MPQRLKGFREPPMLVFGPASTSFIVVEPNTTSKDPTTYQTNKETTVNYYQTS